MMTDKQQLEYYNKAQKKLNQYIERFKEKGQKIDNDYIVAQLKK